MIRELWGIAEEKNSFIWLAKSYWLQSRMALLDLDLEEAQALLIQAKSIAKTKGLQRIAGMISREYSSLLDDIKTWQKLAIQKPPMNEIVELTQLKELLNGMIYNKLQREEEEILDYAARARVFVKMLEKR